MLKIFHLSLLLLGALFATAARAESVLFLNPGSTQEAFWLSYSQFMQVAARDLGIELQILYAQRQPELTIAQARLALQGPNRPDYLMFVNEQYVAPQILRLAENSGVKLFMVNAALTPNQQALVGERPDRIGSLVPNDEEGGYLMMKELIRLHPPVAANEEIELLAFSGLKITPSAQLREHGMQRALAE
ncbi:LacI family transcriptional regulator, partial [Pseudomonas sp. HMWF005]